MSENHFFYVAPGDRLRVYASSAITFLVPFGALMVTKVLDASPGIQLAVGFSVAFATAAVTIRLLPKNDRSTSLDRVQPPTGEPTRRI